ncbi:TorF family putative porin [Pseudoalteromonas luteoviolacea]|uniref:TorF family putative porin n=1 Tax=Pseudoalteromonas luteoviolacea TaxID=43657 RepID=UPI001EEF09DC|nr:TorF family putative porin [Pseudoalteromonas luteoviolacea]MCF6439312.1 TorF family putative porin [Pseudoalteromonas luteoviolacea]
MKASNKVSALSLLICSNFAMADWSTTLTAASDYTFNGVSQTQNDPAIQASLDKAFEGGVYAGSWASNVDFGDTDIEWDFYLGKYVELDEQWSADYGIAYYSYHGARESSDGNYPEAYAKFGYSNALGQTEFNFWYSWDYFGEGAGHVIAMIAHTIEVMPNHALRASVDVSNSLDGDKWLWQNTDKSYYHYRLAYQTSLHQFNIEIAAENTSLDFDTADERLVVSLSRAFSM